MSGAPETSESIPNAGVDTAFNGQTEDIPPLDGLSGGFQAPSLEQLLAMVETMDGLSDEDREDLKRQLLQQQDGNLVPGAEASNFTSEAFILLFAVSFIISIFVFFGYKLYKSLKDKERKKDEKRRLKQQKKKK